MGIFSKKTSSPDSVAHKSVGGKEGGIMDMIRRIEKDYLIENGGQTEFA